MNKQKKNRVLTITGHEPIELDSVHSDWLHGWIDILASELVDRSDPVSFAQGLSREFRAWLRTEVLVTATVDDLLSEIGDMSSEAVTAIWERSGEEIRRRGIELGKRLEKPDVAESALETTIRGMIQADPREALEAFESLASFCGKAAAAVRAQLGQPAPSDVVVQQVIRRTVTREVWWKELVLVVLPNPAVHQPFDILTNPTDRWRWLDMARKEGLLALTRCGLALWLPPSDVNGDIVRSNHADDYLRLGEGATIDWDGFPELPPPAGGDL